MVGRHHHRRQHLRGDRRVQPGLRRPLGAGQRPQQRHHPRQRHQGRGKIRADGSTPSWGYTICTEPTREGTVIENNRLYRGFYNVFKTTKDTTDTIFRNNVIDLTVANGVQPYYDAFYRTVNLYDGARNRVTGNTIYVPAGAAASSEIIYKAEPTSIVSDNKIVRKK